ncbi:phosphoketolase family protein [Dellaglioa carnosa]|uniref:Probable phosphoketolase n=2 Tax=Dellaglioa carnosa TaxID=2995136 RepID=A0ABT4JLL4_9LACO|nr:phosphoketolase family protein [Dellaglioa carnosa]MCZ2491248.1 phosphoketolase family protein [Dellaglioa carnosa]MCZ2494326.1 phosphoketolase family protein [Dellaglioa carnosa]MDK1731258.1 phosphoketolase family protein [Dellaglioa carnosa]
MTETDFSSKSYLDKVDAWWRAANYLSVGQLYLKQNPLLQTDVVPEDIKVNPIGHWGTISGQNFIYAHLNRAINKYDLNMFYIEGPGHGGQVMVSNAYLDGSYTEIYPKITQDLTGMQRLFKQFSFPGGVASHAAPETPGSIHEGGELGYSLSHAAGAILDNPDVIAATVIGDGESETGPLATSWFSNVFINPVNDGAVLPILDMNGFKISNPTILSRKSDADLTKYFEGMGWDPIFVEGTDPEIIHPDMAKKMDLAIEKIKAIQTEARKHPAEEATMPKWPVMIVRTPKGWTGPAQWDNEPIEASFRAHQVPIPVTQRHMEHIDSLVDWMKSYRPEELFTKDGQLIPELKEMAPKGNQRMAMNPITNGGINPQKLVMPDWKKNAVDTSTPGAVTAQDMIVFGDFARDIIEENPKNFRIFGPDETKSNRLNAVFEATNRQWLEPIKKGNDEWQSPVGRVLDSQLSEHQAEGWMEGYVLTGRHGFFASYESFLRVVDSMLTQHFKWLRKAKEQSWRNHYPSLNVIATSTVFQQDHNGYTHQDPGILGHLADKKPEFIREYTPADANSLLAVMNTTLQSEELINLVVSSKHPRPQFYSADEAQELVENGLKVIDWASTAKGDDVDIVIAAAGTEPNLESLAAVDLLNAAFPELKIRFINVVDILKLRHPKIDPRGFSDEEFDNYFTTDKPVVFAFHGFEAMVRDIFYDRHNHNIAIHGYRENGDITTPFDMRVLNQMDRFNLAKDAVLQAGHLGAMGDAFVKEMDAKIAEHEAYIREHGDDLPEVNNWKWTSLRS